MVHRFMKLSGMFASLIPMLFLFFYAHPAFAADTAHTQSLGASLPLWSAVPFVAILLCIALLPLFAHHFWENNRNKGILSLALAIPFAVYLLMTYGTQGQHELLHALKDFVSFISLLGALFVISGGIYVRGSLSGTPLGNVGIMAIGAVLANLIGTTGASMVLIRPLLRANSRRENKVHIVIFFIFVVSNCGGLLTPLGDPPLFLGFLKGVPFTWTLALWKEWLLMNAILLLAFNFVDQYILDREEKRRTEHVLDEVLVHEPVGLSGMLNLAFLLGVILVVIGKGQGIGFGGKEWPFGLQEGLMLLLAFAGYKTTRPANREANRFSFGPIVEVAVLFIGIFITMIAPLQLLNAHGAELGLSDGWHYFWASGMLSSFLDNAPTYMTFAAAAAGQMGVSADGPRYLYEFLFQTTDPVLAAELLAAISCGAVFMGANTYIGNGPNFMVKAIAEENGIKMPSFFGYMAWSMGILIPILIAITFLFFV